jgi:hypothetical protein
MIPPIYYQAATLKSTVGASPCVNVEPPSDSGGKITVTSCTEAVAQALQFVLGNTKRVTFVDVSGKVIPPLSEEKEEKTTAFVRAQIERALDGNGLFVKVHVMPIPNTLSVEFRKEVIQFWADNIFDPYGNNNFVAADLFRSVLKTKPFPGFELGTTTSRAKP